MNYKEQYKEENNQDAVEYNPERCWFYTDEYVRWLESKLDATNGLIETKINEGEDQ